MGLEVTQYIGGVWVNGDVRFANISGTPIDSAVDSLDGELIADEYTLVASAISAGVGTITVQTAAESNPYNGRVVASVAFDGATGYKNIVPGATIVFALGSANGNSGKIYVGKYWGSFDAFGVGAGTPSAGLRHRVENTGSIDISEAKARLLPSSVMVKKTGKVLSSIDPTAEGATEKVSGVRTMAYVLSIANVSGSGGSKVADLKVDGVLLGAATVLDVTTGTTQTGAALKAIANYPYVIVDGPLEGLRFNIDPACANADTCNVLIFPSRYVQIAPDSAGVAGTYGIDDLDLTETGQSTGVISNGGFAYFWARVAVPSNSASESNPHPTGVSVEGIETVDADW